MPRPNPLRSIGGEDNLAQRIKRERVARSLSYEALAKKMTAAGCPMQGSALFKIEKGEPRRTIAVDELLAFAQVFDTDVPDLLRPVEVIDKERAKEVMSKLDDAGGRLAASSTDLVNGCWELLMMAADDNDRELFEYVVGHLQGDMKEDGNPDLFNLGRILAADFAVPDGLIRDAVLTYLDRMLHEARALAKRDLSSRTGARSGKR